MGRFSALVAVLLLSSSALADEPESPIPQELSSDVRTTIVVDFKDGTTKSEYDAAEVGWGIDVEYNSIAGPSTGITLSRDALPAYEVDALLARIRQDPRVEAAEPLQTYQAFFTPNDPRYGEQWNLKLAKVPEAWERSTGKGVVVAVIDTGIAFEDHGRFKIVEDLSGARFAKGWDFVHDNEHANDDNGHGTHVAGTIAQVTNNKIGVAGVAYDATLMPIKVLSGAGFGNTADIADGIRWAADHGAHVVNMSLGGPMPSLVMSNAVAYARKKGVIVVAAAGNGGGRCRETCSVSYPAAYQGVIAVSAVGPDGTLASYSSWGKELDIAAPGGEKRTGTQNGILQATIDPSSPAATVYEFYQGTSMASPHVAGIVALLIANGVKTQEAIEKALYDSAVDKGEKGWDQKYGHGLIDANAALSRGGGPMIPMPRDLGPVAWRFLLGMAVAGMAQRTLRKKFAFQVPPIDGWFVTGGMMACVGLFFLGWFGLTRIPFAGDFFAMLAQPIPEWETRILGMRTPLFRSAFVPLALAIATIPFKPTRHLTAGICLGWSAFLLAEAFDAQGLGFLPFLPIAPIAFLWLALNSVACFFLGRSLLRVSAQVAPLGNLQ